MKLELGASSRVSGLEEKIAALEKEKADLEASLTIARSEAENSSKLLDEAHQRAEAAEEATKVAEARRERVQQTVELYR